MGHKNQFCLLFLITMNIPNYFYRDSENREIGPLPLPALAQLRQAGVLNDDTLMRAENEAAWTECRNVIAGAPALAAQANTPVANVPHKGGWKMQRGHYLALAALALAAAVYYGLRTIHHLPNANQSWENSLGMKFVPVPGVSVLFSVWDTRVQDYQVFVNETRREWPKTGWEQGPTHPAVNITWDDAQAFCAWLTMKERAAGQLGPDQQYRLPTDAEWSVAVGLADPRDGLPESKSIAGAPRGAYPWGTQWPPPHGAGNYADETLVRILGLAGIPGYDDGYAYTSPVGSFAANRFGLYDMGGNVWQWCEGDNPNAGSIHVSRGASFADFDRGTLLSSSHRDDISETRLKIVGFRCVLVVASSPPTLVINQGEGATLPTIPWPGVSKTDFDRASQFAVNLFQTDPDMRKLTLADRDGSEFMRKLDALVSSKAESNPEIKATCAAIKGERDEAKVFARIVRLMQSDPDLRVLLPEWFKIRYKFDELLISKAGSDPGLKAILETIANSRHELQIRAMSEGASSVP